MIDIALNAHLLSGDDSYRSAGIHNVIHHLLLHLPQHAPPDWRFTAYVGRQVGAQYDGITMRRSWLDTQPPLRRIVWEQCLQPPQIAGADLYHAMAFVAPVVLPAPMVATVYDLTFMRYPQRLTRARRHYLQAFTAWTCRRARRITVISRSTGQDLVELLGIAPEKIDVTPLGYDTARYRVLPPDQVAAFRERAGLPERFWMYLGTLEPRKNLVMLIEAYAALPPHERLPLYLAGGRGWDYQPILAAIERHGLADDVRLPGFLPTDEVPLWYNSAEVFLYPSVFEGFGLPVLEAMACGTPVITSNVSSLPEVAAGAGLCISPHDVAAWTHALHIAATDTTWRDRARERGLNKAQQFRWSETARLTVESYRRALTHDTG